MATAGPPLADRQWDLRADGVRSGSALEDLAAAMLVWRRLGGSAP